MSCVPDEVTVDAPDDLISSAEMVQLIIDLQIMETHYQRHYQKPENYKRALDSSCTFIFQDHEVTKEQYERSFGYYSLDASIMFSMYEAVLDTMNLRASEGSIPLEEL